MSVLQNECSTIMSVLQNECSAIMNVLQKPAQELVFLQFWSKNFKNMCEGLQPAFLLKIKSFTRKCQGF